MPRFRPWICSISCALLALSPIGFKDFSWAKEPAQATASSPKPLTAVRPALWKIADEDTTIYLFGTIHILTEEVDWYHGPVAEALATSQELVTEILMDDSKQAESLFAAMAKREDGQTLRSTLPKNERKAYEAALAKMGLPANAFDATDAWFAALMLTMIPLQSAGYNTQNGIDTQVSLKARDVGITNTAFETMTYQIGLFDNLPPTTQRAYLSEVIKSLPSMNTSIGGMVKSWKVGDAEHLAKLMNEDSSDPVMRKVLLLDRNASWATWLKNRMDKPGSVFVAVGAGHLAGPGSVQEQLADYGLTATRIQ